ncbi:hypothetical protein [Streptomyces sp. NPDC001108]
MSAAPEHTNTDPPHYERLLNLSAMTTWTASRQQEHAADAVSYASALAAMQAGLRSQGIDGDGRWDAARRSRRVEKHLKRMVRAARKQERAAEDLRNAYAAHVAHVTALPAQREAKRAAKELRKGPRQVVGEIAAKSLNKSASAFTQAEAGEAAPSETGSAAEPKKAAPARGVSDLWQRGA